MSPVMSPITSWFGTLTKMAVALMAALAAFVVTVPTTVDAAEERHCVVDVTHTTREGRFITGPEVCFSSLGQVERFVGADAEGWDRIADQLDLSGERSVARRSMGYSAVIGIHFTGYNGTGSSVTITGSNCGGGYWNTTTSWDNVISSSYNGCARLRHYANPNLSGSSTSTYGVGTTDNIYGSMNNNTESIQYLSS